MPIIIAIVSQFLPLSGLGQEVGGSEVKNETWLMPSPEIQLYIEGLDDRKGLGRIFVPAITSGANEPLYAVFQNDELIGERNMGESFFLIPGNYTVVLGSGNLDQRVRREVIVGREETVFLHPDWCALTIEVIDESRNYFKQDLQIFRVETAESYGIIPAINPELGEHLQTLILPAGLYKIVRRGEDFNTYVNFSTLLLEPGSYTPYTIVINTETTNFIGAGILTALSQLRQRRNWSLFGAVHGSVILTGANDESSDEIKTNLSLLGQLDNRMLYDQFPHYYLSNNLLELGAQRQEGAQFQVTQDLLRSKNTYVYYLLKWLGGYGSLKATTHLFEKSSRFDRTKQVILLDEPADTVRTKKVRTQPTLFPLELKEGIGVNITPLQTFMARLSLRAGLGYWQTYNRDVYIKKSESNDFAEFDPVYDIFQQGVNTTLISYLALLHNLSITTEIDILFPFDPDEEISLDLENFISIGISKNVTLEHTLRLKSNPDPVRKHIVQEQFISVRLSYYLF